MEKSNLQLVRELQQETTAYPKNRSWEKKSVNYHVDPLSINYRSIIIKSVPQTCVSYQQKQQREADKAEGTVYFDFSKYLTFTQNDDINSQQQIQNEKQKPKNIPEITNELPKKKIIKKMKNRKIPKKTKQESEDYVPIDSGQSQQNFKGLSQTKNIVKNFGKSIYAFILKQKSLTSKLLAIQNVDQDDFLNNLARYKENLATIYGLRSFWSDVNNPYARQIRILSSFFLRKYCLRHIFNSRVQNYHRNIKYRYKMMKSLSNPVDFTHIKQY